MTRRQPDRPLCWTLATPSATRHVRDFGVSCWPAPERGGTSAVRPQPSVVCREGSTVNPCLRQSQKKQCDWPARHRLVKLTVLIVRRLGRHGPGWRRPCAVIRPKRPSDASRLEVSAPCSNNAGAAADLIPFSSFFYSSHPPHSCFTDSDSTVHRAHPPERPCRSVKPVEPSVLRADSSSLSFAPAHSAAKWNTQLTDGTRPAFNA